MEHPSRLGELPLQAHVLIDERGDVDVALALHLARRPDDSQLPHPVRPAPTLDDDLLTAALKDPLVLHGRRYRPLSPTTLRQCQASACKWAVCGRQSAVSTKSVNA